MSDSESEEEIETGPKPFIDRSKALSRSNRVLLTAFLKIHKFCLISSIDGFDILFIIIKLMIILL
uniref:Uncharacterized protein n=1 Tax=viral metagenome TaxID=1070528 RepID=A0A6C0H131_9ZZZZ